MSSKASVSLADTGLIVGEDLFRFMEEAAESDRIASILLDSYASRAVVTTDAVNYLDVTEDGRISFMPTNRVERAVGEGRDPISGGGRQSLSAGKALRRIIKPECFTDPIVVTVRRPRWHGECERSVALPGGPITDADVERLAVKIQAHFRPIEPFIVVGEAIRYWYWEQNYTEDQRSTLHTSCMRYIDNWDQLRFYARNPRVIGMLCVLGSDGGLAARAILWNGHNGIFMDRVYGTDQQRRAIRRFAKDRGWFMRRSDYADEREGDAGFFAVPLQRAVRGELPYLDSMAAHNYYATGDQVGTVDRWVSHSPNSIDYGAAVLNGIGYAPPGHPLHNPGSSARIGAAQRDRRVAWLSDFSAIPPWPTDLLRTNPAWTLAGHSDPEHDEINWPFVPPQRTEALVVERPKPAPSAWAEITTTNGSGTYHYTAANVSAFQARLDALRIAFVTTAEREDVTPSGVPF